MLRGRRTAYHRRGLAVGLTTGGVAAPVQVVVGDWAVRQVADNQPAKLAAMEGIGRTGPDAPLSIGGVWDGDSLRGAVEVPGALSYLLHGRTDAVVVGLDVLAPGDRPPVTFTHLAFDLMVAIGLGLVALAGWALWRWRRRDLDGSRWFLRAVAVSGPATVVALLAGWIVTEVGRQPWIVYLRLRTADAVSDQAGLYWFFYGTVAVYLLLSVSLVAILRSQARSGTWLP